MKRLFYYLGERLNKISALKLTFLAVLSALVVGAFIIVVSDIDNLRDGDIVGALSTVGSAYWALVVGSFGSLRAISNTINSSTPLILCGVSVAIAFKAGLFNIGATGQMLAGGMTALWVGFAMDGPGYIQVPLAIIAGAVGGAIFGAILAFEGSHWRARSNHHNHVEQHCGVSYLVAAQDRFVSTRRPHRPHFQVGKYGRSLAAAVWLPGRPL